MKANMRYRTLGKTGYQISEIGYGAWGISGAQWIGADDNRSLDALRRAIELGLNFIDTALAYGDGHSEQLVGQVVRDAPGKVFVSTKVPPKNLLWPARTGIPISEVFPYDYIIKSTETSLRNLNMESVDLQQLHVWNPEWLDTDDWKRGFEELKRSGKARAVGISINDHAPDSALEAVRTGLIDSVQVIYNIFDQSPDENLLPLCQELNVGVLARVPLDEGGLTGTITPDTDFPEADWRHLYFAGDRKRQVHERVQALEADLKDTPGTLPEKALRYCLSHPAVTTVIPGMRRISTVESSLSVSALGPLDAATLTTLKSHRWPRNFYPM
jgi:aryl-alcohol dehydrogenase-like predicted oxidoreductase